MIHTFVHCSQPPQEWGYTVIPPLVKIGASTLDNRHTNTGVRHMCTEPTGRLVGYPDVRKTTPCTLQVYVGTGCRIGHDKEGHINIGICGTGDTAIGQVICLTQPEAMKLADRLLKMLELFEMRLQEQL